MPRSVSGTGGTTGSGGSGAPRKGLLVGAGVAVAAVLAVGAFLVFGRGGDGDADADETEQTDAPDETSAETDPPDETIASTTAATEPDTTEAATTIAQSTTTTEPPGACDGVNEPCIELTRVGVAPGGAIEVTWEPFNFEPDVIAGFHAHLYWNDVTAEQSGNNGAPGSREWDAHDETIHTSSLLVIGTKPPAATEVCVTVGLAPNHNVPNPKIFDCLPIPE